MTELHNRGGAGAVGLEVWRLDEYLQRPLSEPAPLLAPWLREGHHWMVYSAAGCGKTFFALNVAFAVASGGKYLHWKAPAPRTVLYCDGEMAAWEMQARLSAIVGAARKSRNGITHQAGQNFFGFAAGCQPDGSVYPDLATAEGCNVLLDMAKGRDLVVVDNLLTTMPSGDPNEAGSWTAMQTALVEFRKRGTAVLLVHHSGKNGDQLGTSTKTVILNGVMRLQAPPDYDTADGLHWVLSFEKNRGLKGGDTTSVEAALKEDEDGLPLWEYTVVDRGAHRKLKRLLQSGEHGTLQEIANQWDVEAPVTKQYVSKLKEEAVAAGLFTAKQCNDWLRVGKDAKRIEAEEATGHSDF